MQRLEIYRSLWAMELRDPKRPERSREDAFEMIAAAGFDGVCLDPAVDEIPECRELAHLYQEHDLDCMINAFPATGDDMVPLLDFAVEMNACQVNVISGVVPIRPEDAVATVRGWIGEAADREMRAPIQERDQAFMSSVLERSDCFQGRVANREQVQVQVNFPQHQEWVEIFKRWWKEGMRAWRKRNEQDATLVFLCELGPPPYAITDANQNELSDRWEEALQIREWVRAIWLELDNEN